MFQHISINIFQIQSIKVQQETVQSIVLQLFKSMTNHRTNITRFVISLHGSFSLSINNSVICIVVEFVLYTAN